MDLHTLRENKKDFIDEIDKRINPNPRQGEIVIKLANFWNKIKSPPSCPFYEWVQREFDQLVITYGITFCVISVKVISFVFSSKTLIKDLAKIE